MRHLAQGRAVLDLCCYTGGFAVNALAGGATHVTGGCLSQHPSCNLPKKLENLQSVSTTVKTGLNFHVTVSFWQMCTIQPRALVLHTTAVLIF